MLAARIVACLFVALATYVFVYWVPFSLLPIGEERWIARIGSLSSALLVSGVLWSATRSIPRTLVTSAFVGAVAVGTIGFIAGFFGPLIFTPEANQGPLLGLFITGPGGAILGTIGGGVYWLVARRGDDRLA